MAGIAKGAAGGMGIASIATGLGFSAGLRVYADGSASIGICRRAGIGRARHLAAVSYTHLRAHETSAHL
eukprot:12242815-Alexandrium_andersonii.AAC.1